MAMSDYARGLSKDAKEQYCRKLLLIEGQDPYAIKMSDYNLSLNDLPKITMAVMLDFLIFRVSEITQKEIRSYKGLDAFAQFAAGWIQEIKAKKFKGNFCVVGKVMHSQKVADPCLQVWIILSEKGEILATHCTCIAGLGEACTHVSAILFALEYAGKSMESVTDVLAYWIGPKTKKEFYKPLADIDFQKASSTTEQFEKLENCQDLSPQEVEAFLRKYQEDGGVAVLHGFFDTTIANGSSPLLLVDLFQVQYADLGLEELHQLSYNFEKKINESVSAAELKRIEVETRDQSKSKKWFLYRAGRITASNLKGVCHTNLETPSLSLVKRICYPHIYRRTFSAGKYGCDHEKEAITAFVNNHKSIHPNCLVKKNGLYINQKYLCLAATPDSMLECDVCGYGCIEVKCPYCARDTSIAELIKVKKTCIIDGETPFLDCKHQYYYQVQMQMAITSTKYCYFVVWSKSDFFIQKIEFDENFWEIKSAIAMNFHKNVILPELLGKYFTQSKTEAPSVSRCLPIAEDTELWCHCRTPDDGEQMIGCSNKKCLIKWYHYKCLSLKKIPKGKWYCDDCQKK